MCFGTRRLPGMSYSRQKGVGSVLHAGGGEGSRHLPEDKWCLQRGNGFQEPSSWLGQLLSKKAAFLLSAGRAKSPPNPLPWESLIYPRRRSIWSQRGRQMEKPDSSEMSNWVGRFITQLFATKYFETTLLLAGF